MSRVQGLGFRVWNLGAKVQGLGMMAGGRGFAPEGAVVPSDTLAVAATRRLSPPRAHVETRHARPPLAARAVSRGVAHAVAAARVAGAARALVHARLAAVPESAFALPGRVAHPARPARNPQHIWTLPTTHHPSTMSASAGQTGACVGWGRDFSEATTNRGEKGAYFKCLIVEVGGRVWRGTGSGDGGEEERTRYSQASPR